MLYNLLNPIIILDKKWYKQWKLYTKLHHMYVDAYKNVVPIINHIRRPSLEPKIGYFLCSFTRSWQIDQTCLYLQMHPSSQSEISWEIAARKLSFWQLVRALRELLFTPTQNNIKTALVDRNYMNRIGSRLCCKQRYLISLQYVKIVVKYAITFW